jgi:hypothetical protein
MLLWRVVSLPIFMQKRSCHIRDNDALVELTPRNSVIVLVPGQTGHLGGRGIGASANPKVRTGEVGRKNF